jgi:hypothetical protein
MRWAELEMGINSVAPWTSPKIIDSIMIANMVLLH